MLGSLGIARNTTTRTRLVRSGSLDVRRFASSRICFGFGVPEHSGPVVRVDVVEGEVVGDREADETRF